MEHSDSLAKWIQGNYPVRLRRAQKDAFLQEACGLLHEMGYAAAISDDPFLAKNRNLVAGSLCGEDRGAGDCRLVFTAHYDTPYRMLIGSNMLFPKSLLLTVLVQLPIVLPLILPMVLSELAGIWLRLPFPLIVCMGLAALFLSMWLVLFCFTNPHNANDNTSGVLTVLSIAQQLPEELRGQVGFVLFDNEEKMMLGSGGFKKRYRGRLKRASIFNFDCVGVGEELLLLCNGKAMADTRLIESLEKARPEAAGIKLETVSAKGYTYPSDHMQFSKWVAGAAFRRGKAGLYINRLHTARDTAFNIHNINVLSTWMVRFVEEYHGKTDR